MVKTRKIKLGERYVSFRDYVSLNGLMLASAFSMLALISFAIVSACAALDISTAVHRFWTIGISHATIVGVGLLSMIVATISHLLHGSREEMSARHNMDLYMGLIVFLITYVLSVSFSMLWLLNHVPTLSKSGIVILSSLSHHGLRSYISLQVVLTFLSLIAAYATARATLVHFHPTRVVHGLSRRLAPSDLTMRDSKYISKNAVTLSGSFSALALISFAVVSVCAVLNVSAASQKFWVIAISQAVVVGVGYLSYLGSTAGYILQDTRHSMSPRHNMEIYLASIVFTVTLAVSVALSFMWLKTNAIVAPTLSTSINVAALTGPSLRTYNALQVVLILMDVIAAYCLGRSVLVNLHPARETSINRDD
jgi:hypothetical protein